MALEIDEKKIVSTVKVWSNGRVIRRYQGQDKIGAYNGPSKGFRIMTAILVETEESE